ncbi:MAG: carbonic anhydrase family protein [Bauldia sp.]|nr:carbonic anhydrase family protein [Bauldia sp.]
MLRDAIAGASALAVIAGAGFWSMAGAQEVHHWTYQGEAGPANWGELEEGYAACAVGLEQSPIDIPADAAMSEVDLVFDYRPTALHVVNNGHTIQLDYDAGSTLAVDGKAYSVLQFHFHVPSEHTVEGVASPLEMHIVHRADDGALAVVGVLFDFAAADNGFLAPFWSDLPAAGETVDLPGEINVADAFDPAGGRYGYRGSLTTPPCSEGVSWFVMAGHQSVSTAQVAAFVALLGMNARPTQEPNARQIGG